MRVRKQSGTWRDVRHAPIGAGQSRSFTGMTLANLYTGLHREQTRKCACSASGQCPACIATDRLRMSLRGSQATTPLPWMQTPYDRQSQGITAHHARESNPLSERVVTVQPKRGNFPVSLTESAQVLVKTLVARNCEQGCERFAPVSGINALTRLSAPDDFTGESTRDIPKGNARSNPQHTLSTSGSSANLDCSDLDSYESLYQTHSGQFGTELDTQGVEQFPRFGWLYVGSTQGVKLPLGR